jgi:hypothetical protein
MRPSMARPNTHRGALLAHSARVAKKDHESNGDLPAGLDRKACEKALVTLQARLRNLQEWVNEKGAARHPRVRRSRRRRQGRHDQGAASSW